MTRGITIALMGLFLMTAPAYAASDIVTPSSKAITVDSKGIDTKADLPAYKTLKVTLTGYNAVPGQTDDDPTTTASGAYSDPNIVAARSRDLAAELPFGTIIDIEPSSHTGSCGISAVQSQIGLRVIADTMNARMHNKVDVLLKTVNAARALGVCKVTVRVVGHVDIADIPHTQSELAAAVSDTELAINK